MGRTLQNKKRRSSRSTIRQANKLKKPLNPRGNSIIAQNWDKNETLTQNYRRIGLTSRLKTPSGGIEKFVRNVGKAPKQTRLDPLGIKSIDRAVVTSARVERDADGKIVKIHMPEDSGRPPRANPLNDPLRQFDSDSEDEDEDEEEWGGVEDDENKPEVLRMLEEEAARPELKKPRHQSEQETEWLEKLIKRHGDNYEAMAWDRKLNPMQQTAGDLRRRVAKLRASE
ncbi:Nop16-like protein [Plectosphaerella cucumerina]|uniref:Nucleolar protein 16 n=1 Tax=Plectosphaerella cucumerina TaxID=40658 RepID=A0A8K0X3X4_9PEZI|nr:Nop16-like protein [Plectosphaerella cucumerina]